MIYNYDEYKKLADTWKFTTGDEIIFLPIFKKVKKFMEAPCSANIPFNQKEVIDENGIITLVPEGKNYLAKSRQTESLEEIQSFIESNLDNEEFALYMVLKRPLLQIGTENRYIIRYSD